MRYGVGTLANKGLTVNTPSSLWHPVMIDRRGSMTLPADMKRLNGFTEGTVLMARALDGIVALVPFNRFAQAQPSPVTDHQKDATMALMLTEALHGRSTVSVPLFAPHREQAAAPEWAEAETESTDGKEWLVYMNKKGFIPTPEEVKKTLGMEMGDSFMVEIRKMEGKLVVLLAPLSTKSSLEAYFQRRRQEHVREAEEQAELQRREARLAALKEEIATLTRTRELLEADVRKKRAAANGENLFANLLRGEEAKNKTVASPGEAGNPVPDHMNPNKPPTEKLEPGQQWNFGSFGWVKVDDVDYVEPETKA